MSGKAAYTGCAGSGSGAGIGASALKAVFAHEAPLIVFTTFSPAAAGVALAALVCAAFGGADVDVAALQFGLSISACALVTVGMAASVLHLAKPLRAPYSLIHWKESWLSREILAVSAFWACSAVWVAASAMSFAGVLGAWAAIAGCALVSAMGAVLVFVISMAYRTNGQPAWRGTEVFFELAACALRCGCACAVAVICSMCAACAEYLAPPALPCMLAAVGFASAFALDGWASTARASRLSAEDGATRVVEVCALSRRWSPLASRVQTAATILGVVMAACTLVPAPLPCAVICVAVAVATFALQAVLRACFYGLFTTARTVPRFKAVS